VVEGKKRLRVLLPLLIPHLVGKRTQATLVAEWCNFEGYRRTVSQHDLELVENVRTLNQTGVR